MLIYMRNEKWRSDIRHIPILMGFLFLPLGIEVLGTSVLVDRVGGGVPKILSLMPLLLLMYLLFYRAVVFRLGYLPAGQWRKNAGGDPLSWVVFAFFLHISTAQIASLYTMGGGLGVIVDGLTYLSYFGLFVFLRGAVVSGNDTHDFGVVFLISLLLLIAVNFILVAAGQQVGQAASDFGAEDASNKILGLLGIVFRRVQFPWISGGLNGFAVLCIALYSVGISAIFNAKMNKVFLRGIGAGAVFISILGLVLIDSRGGVLAVVALSLLVPFVVRRKNGGWLLPVAVVIVQLFPLALIFIAPILEGTPILAILSRGVYSDPAADITTGRSYIWRAVWDELVERPYGFIFGFGSMGHVVSGISSKYAFVFGGGGVTAHSTHNALLQTLIDKGLVGVIFYVILLWMLTKRLLALVKQRLIGGGVDGWILMAFLYMIVGLSILAQTEAIMTSYFPISLYFLAICSAFATPSIKRGGHLLS